MTAPTSTVARVDRRLPGADVVRAVALIGVVIMNYHGYLVLRDGRGAGDVGTGWAAELFDPWDGPLSTRFAATFVLVAGVGVTLMTRGAVARPADTGRITQLRWRLVRRGLLLYVVGLLLDEIWPGTILPFYGAMFMLSAVIFTWRSRWIATVGLISAATGSGIRVWRYERAQDGWSTGWLTSPAEGSLRDHLFGVFVNGTHPLLPWFAFFCAGILLGRLLRTRWWRRATIGVGLAFVAVAAIVPAAASTEFQRVAWSINPLDRGIVYTVSALGSALVIFALVDAIAERFPVAVDPLRRAGQMTLSLYIAHILVFNLVVDWLGWIRPTGLDAALAFAVTFWIIAIGAGVVWQRRFGLGPAERIYRAVGG